MLPHFYYSPEILRYDFGPQHPLKPERLRRTIELLGRYGVEPIDPGPGKVEDVLRVHDEEFVDAVRSGGGIEFGFGKGDNPAFPGIFDAAMAYVSSTARAAEAVRDGSMLAYGIGGGLHHALRNRASGFCIFDDPAVACHILLERFERVAYVDIDVHHGDGVQWIFYNEPRVLTCSIHEEGRTLFPGTGFVEETGTEFSSLNVPLQAYTSGDVWLSAFERGILPGLEAFQPQAIVLQLGTDTHALDPLGHIKSTAQHWLGAVERIRDLYLPIVAVGGGGYNLTTVPRMWTAACLTLANVPFEPILPDELGKEWGVAGFFDDETDLAREVGAQFADRVIEHLKSDVLPNVGK